MNPVDATTVDPITEMDAARAAARHSTDPVLRAITALLAQLYPEASYVTLRRHDGFVSICDVCTSEGHRHSGPTRRGRPMFPPHLIGNWPLTRLPKRDTRPHLGRHADDSERTLNNLLTDAWRAGAQLPVGACGPFHATRLALR